MENIFYEGSRDNSRQTLISENKNNQFPRHFHKNIELHYIREGRVLARINDKEYLATKDTLILIPPFFAHEFTSPDNSESIILVPTSDLVSDLSDYFDNNVVPVFLTDCEYNRNILLVLTALLNCSNEITQKVLSQFVNILLGMIFSHYPAEKQDTNSLYNLAIEIQSYIDKNYMNELSLDGIADAMGYSKYYVSKTLKKYTGKNFYSYINTVRIEHAVSMYVNESRCSYEELGRRCGFQNTTTFFRAFRAVYGTTPKNYFRKLPSAIEHYEASYSKGGEFAYSLRANN